MFKSKLRAGKPMSSPTLFLYKRSTGIHPKEMQYALSDTLMVKDKIALYSGLEVMEALLPDHPAESAARKWAVKLTALGSK